MLNRAIAAGVLLLIAGGTSASASVPAAPTPIDQVACALTGTWTDIGAGPGESEYSLDGRGGCGRQNWTAAFTGTGSITYSDVALPCTVVPGYVPLPSTPYGHADLYADIVLRRTGDGATQTVRTWWTLSGVAEYPSGTVATFRITGERTGEAVVSALPDPCLSSEFGGPGTPVRIALSLR